MTTQTAVDLFAVLQDKYGSPDFSEDEAVNLLNMATFEWLNRQFPTAQGGLSNVEQDSNALHLIQPLIKTFTQSYSTIASGVIPILQIPTTEDDIFRYLEVNFTLNSVTYPVKWLKHNDYARFSRNTFKAARIPDKVRYQIISEGIRIKPETGYTAGTFSFTVIKKPTLLEIDVDPEITDEGMYNIISLALKLAGVATRDDELLGAVRASAVQISQ